MGGIGSGRHAGAGLLRDKCHEYHSVDLAWLKKHGCLKTGCSGSLNWSRGGNQTGNIQYVVERSGLRLIYRTRPHGREEWSDINELVPFVSTATNFSGRRVWFECLSCQKRCRILYGGSLFRCRRCYDLKYETQYEPPFARAATKALNIRKRLGARGGIDDPFPEKPKGMHWKTYERHQSEYYALCNSWAAGLMQKWNMGEG